MNRVFWFFGEVLIGVLAAGVLSAIVTPLLIRAGRDPGPAAVWFTFVVSILLCILIGGRLRRTRNRHRLS